MINEILGGGGLHASHGGLVELDAEVTAAAIGTIGARTGEPQHGSRGHLRPFQRQWQTVAGVRKRGELNAWRGHLAGYCNNPPTEKVSHVLAETDYHWEDPFVLAAGPGQELPGGNN